MWTLTRWCNRNICASRLREDDKGNVKALYTYGSPKVGGKLFVWNLDELEHYRFVNNNDMVTRVPCGLWGIDIMET